MSKSAESSDLPVLTVKEQWFWTGFGAVTYPRTMRPSTGVDPASKTGVVESQPINGSVKQCDCVFNYMSPMYTAEIGSSTFVARTFSSFEARTEGAVILGCKPPDSSPAIFACGVGDHFRLSSVQSCTARWLRREGAVGGRSESPSTEDVWLRC